MQRLCRRSAIARSVSRAPKPIDEHPDRRDPPPADLCREGRDPFDLFDEIEQSLALGVTPASWPIGMGRDFLGTYDLFADALLLFERSVRDRVTKAVRCNGLDDPKLPQLLPKTALAKLREEVEMAWVSSAASCLTNVNSVL
jgi:peptide subunit release factor RF-3